MLHAISLVEKKCCTDVFSEHGKYSSKLCLMTRVSNLFEYCTYLLCGHLNWPYNVRVVLVRLSVCLSRIACQCNFSAEISAWVVEFMQEDEKGA